MMMPANSHGMVHLPSPFSVSDTLDRLAALASAVGLTLFARIDFSKDAAAVGMTLPPTQLLILGNPKSGTPLMLDVATTAIDLPLKALAWKDNAQRVWLSANTPEYLRERHGVSLELLAAIASFQQLLEAAVRADSRNGN